MAFLRRRKGGEETEQPEDAEQTPEAKSKGSWKRPASPYEHSSHGTTANFSPLDTAFKQQRLKAWQPILTPKVVLPTFFILGVLFAPIGAVLIWGSNLVSRIILLSSFLSY